MIPEDAVSASGSGLTAAQITSVVAHSKGFACAGGAGTVHLFEKTDEKDFYRKARIVKVGKVLLQCCFLYVTECGKTDCCRYHLTHTALIQRKLKTRLLLHLL